MHRGVQALLSWIVENPDFPGLRLAGPAGPLELPEVEDRVLSPLPTDLRMLLSQHNGGALPTGTLLRAGGGGADSILGELERLAQLFGRTSDDPELPLPYFRSHERALLAFDRALEKDPSCAPATSRPRTPPWRTRYAAPVSRSARWPAI